MRVVHVANGAIAKHEGGMEDAGDAAESLSGFRDGLADRRAIAAVGLQVQRLAAFRLDHRERRRCGICAPAADDGDARAWPSGQVPRQSETDAAGAADDQIRCRDRGKAIEREFRASAGRGRAPA